MDLNQNDRILCAGTEPLNHDVYLLFFDVRQSSIMGSYCDGHDDDITQVKFHPTNPDSMMTGSVDGLINLYDISKTNEEDALNGCLNTESSVQTINWHKNVYDKNFITCITHTNDLYLYDANELELEVLHMRKTLTKNLRVSATCIVYL